jgi:hypothetical protein
MFLGDYLSLATNAAILRTMAKHGDKALMFADHVVKVNRRNKMQRRTLLITDQAVYNLDPGSYKVKRRIPLSILGSVSMSSLQDNFFALHVPTEYDYLLVSSKKIEIVTTIVKAYRAATGVGAQGNSSVSRREALAETEEAEAAVTTRLADEIVQSAASADAGLDAIIADGGLPVTISDSFRYRVDAKTTREVKFSAVDDGVSMQVWKADE